MKWSDDYYESLPSGACRKLMVDMDGRFWEYGGEVREKLVVCKRPGRHPHDPAPPPPTPPPKARR